MKKRNLLVLAVLCFFSLVLSGSLLAQEYTINILDLGAIGDGVADDTAAFQAALNVPLGAEESDIYVPPGKYRITQTLVLDRKSSITFRGHARANGPTGTLAPAATTLVWDGASGGTMIHAIGVRTCTFKDMVLDGNLKAGKLLLFTSVDGWGNLLNRISNILFFRSITGLQFGDETSINICNSDVAMDFLFFSQCTNGMLVKNTQGVDYLINYLFATNCTNVLNFEKGGNLMVNNAQNTDCDLFLNIVSGGITCGTFVANMVRVETSDAGSNRRAQLLRAKQEGSTPANITFTGFTDAQWNWRANTSANRFKPLCEIGPEVSLTFEGSIFNSPVADIQGSSLGDAYMVTRECSFIIGTPMNPGDFVTANQYGYFQLINSKNKYKKLVGDVVKWKAVTPVNITTPSHTGAGFTSTTIP